MRLIRLDIRGLRSLEDVQLLPGPGLNLLVGDNGAGKTSVLEAVHLLAYGRSFRGRVRDGLIQTGASAVEVFAEWMDAGPEAPPRRAGLRHSGAEWQARVDGQPVSHLGELCASVASTCFEPGSPSLVTGGAETRRRFLDWGLFHVEHGYLAQWRRYSRALRQRNALLKAQVSGMQLDAWDAELGDAAQPLTQARMLYLDALAPHVAGVAGQLLPAFGLPQLDYRPGWRREQMGLDDALLLARPRDLASGHTTVGPHRADWSVSFARRPGQEPYSRGQAKLVALTCLLGQARLHAERAGHWPVVLLDDLGSELDATHRRRVLDELMHAGAQVFITGVEPLPELDGRAVAMFHVEHGRIQALDQ